MPASEIDPASQQVRDELLAVKCPRCGSKNVAGPYREKFSCNDCHIVWDQVAPHQKVEWPKSTPTETR